jgi:hypothetical protein
LRARAVGFLNSRVRLWMPLGIHLLFTLVPLHILLHEKRALRLHRWVLAGTCFFLPHELHKIKTSLQKLDDILDHYWKHYWIATVR